MRRVYVDQDVASDPEVMESWLASQGLSRFWTTVAYDDTPGTTPRVLIDAHELPAETVVGSIPPVSTKNCDDINCQVCATEAGRHLVIQAEDTGEQEITSFSYEWKDIPATPLVTGPEFADWYKQPRQDDTDPIPRVRPKSKTYRLGWIAVHSIAMAAGFLAAWVCIRLWYVRYGCPFMPDHGFLSACKALTIQVGK